MATKTGGRMSVGRPEKKRASIDVRLSAPRGGERVPRFAARSGGAEQLPIVDVTVATRTSGADLGNRGIRPT